MPLNPYEPPNIPSDARGGRKLRPKGPFGYVMAVLIGVLLGALAVNSVNLFDYSALGMIVASLIAVGLYHFLPHYEQPED